jgi:hypothetical protein
MPMKKDKKGTDPKDSKARKSPKLREIDSTDLEQVGGGGPRHDIIMQ